jgi:transcriptional regulator with XRE-family HTH domain
MGIHRTYAGGLERGEHNLTLRSVERLGHRLGIEPRALLADEASFVDRISALADLSQGVPSDLSTSRA